MEKGKRRNVTMSISRKLHTGIQAFWNRNPLSQYLGSGIHRVESGIQYLGSGIHSVGTWGEKLNSQHQFTALSTKTTVLNRQISSTKTCKSFNFISTQTKIVQDSFLYKGNNFTERKFFNIDQTHIHNGLKS